VDDEEDSERTSSPLPAKYDSLINKEISQFQPSPELDQEIQPPPPENEPQTPPSEHHHTEHETHKTPEPADHVLSDAVVAEQSSPIVNDADKSPHNVATENTFTVPTPLKHHLQALNENLDQDIVQKTPPHQTSHLKHLMHNLSLDCIFIPPHLPSRIINEPLDQTQEDISNFLLAVDKNLRRMCSAIPDRSIDSDHIDKECDIMENGLTSMMNAVREAYKNDLNFRIEMAKKEEERLERERLEAEERERKRLEDERIEKERLEVQAREEARLAEEARIAAEHQ
jgi:hypothetical protein